MSLNQNGSHDHRQRHTRRALVIGAAAAALATAVGLGVREAGKKKAPQAARPAARRNSPAPGQSIVVSGTRTQPIIIRGGAATITGLPGARLVGSDGNGISASSCASLTISGLTISGWRIGIRPDNCRGVVIRDCTVQGSARTGILAVNCANVSLQRVTCSGSREEHGFYHSAYGKQIGRVTVSDSRFLGNGKAGIQINTETGGRQAGGGLIQNCYFEGNGRMGGRRSALNLLGCGTQSEPIIVQNCTVKSPGDGVVAANWNGVPAVVKVIECKFATARTPPVKYDAGARPLWDGKVAGRGASLP